MAALEGQKEIKNMCGRYALYSQDMILSKYNFKIKKNYNVSPNQEVLIIIKKNELISLNWGIQPEWKKNYYN